MPDGALRQCAEPGCYELVEDGKCDKHRRADYRHDNNRPGRADDRAFYSGPRWRRFRAGELAERPFCEDCEDQGIVTASEELHHVKKRKDHPELAFDRKNTRALCTPCHSRRTQRGE